MSRSMCERCSYKGVCSFDYDGRACQKTRDVKHTNYDRIMDMSEDELRSFLETVEDNPPWVSAFARAKCDNCPKETVELEDHHFPIEIYPCDVGKHECPHGSDIAWWLEQEVET